MTCGPWCFGTIISHQHTTLSSHTNYLIYQSSHCYSHQLLIPDFTHIHINYQQQTPSTMKVTAATTLLFAALALASPTSVAQPKAQPKSVETRAQFHNALLSRDAAAAQFAQLDTRKVKGGKGGSGNNTESDASDMFTPSRALQLGALGLGVIQVARLWG
jgi:hypothetical protein